MMDDLKVLMPTERRMVKGESAVFNLGQGRAVFVRQSGDRLIVTSGCRLEILEFNSGKVSVGAKL